MPKRSKPEPELPAYKWNAILIAVLVVLMATSLYIRIKFPYASVFVGDWIKFTSIDAYWQMQHIDAMAPGFLQNITSVHPFFHWLLSAIIWIAGLGSPAQHTIDIVAVYVPPIMAALTIIPVYVLARIIFGPMAGITAAGLIAVLPGEFLGRSLLGFIDHHILEVLLSTTAIMFFVLSLKRKDKWRIIYGALTFATMGLYLLTWAGGIIFIFIILIYLVGQMVYNRRNHKQDAYPVIILGCWVGVLIGLQMAYPPLIPDMITRSQAFLFSQTVTTTLEMRPLLFPYGDFTLLAAWGSFTTAMFIAPVGFGILIWRNIKRWDNSMVLVIVWTVVILVLMLAFRRFAYYGAINVAILMGYLVALVWKRIKVTQLSVAIMVSGFIAILILMPNIQQSTHAATRTIFAPSNAWFKTLEWLNTTPEDSTVLSWWDYGYWIKREGKRTPVATPAQNPDAIKKVANHLLSDNETNHGDIADFVIIDNSMTAGKYWAITTWAGNTPDNYYQAHYVNDTGVLRHVTMYSLMYYKTLSVQLYNFDGKKVLDHRPIVVTFQDRIVNGQKIREVMAAQYFKSYYVARDYLATLPPGNSYIVSDSPFISPVPLSGVDKYRLVYASNETVDGIPEVKVFQNVE